MSERHDPFSMGVNAAETIARRLPVIWWSFWQPTAARQQEMAKMVIEKQMAFAETIVALQAEAFKMMMRPWWEHTPDTHHKAADAMVQAALAPSARRVKANARRLRRW